MTSVRVGSKSSARLFWMPTQICTSYPWAMPILRQSQVEDKDDVLKNGKPHGATLIALRHPEGTQALLNSMEAIPRGKRCHFDQFIFSQLNNVDIAFSDPALVGWAEVSETLTSVGAGCRRNGRGRLGHIPTVSNEIKWVRRAVTYCIV